MILSTLVSGPDVPMIFWGLWFVGAGPGVPVLASHCAPPPQRARRSLVATRKEPRGEGQPWHRVRGPVPQQNGGHRMRAQQLPLWAPLLESTGTGLDPSSCPSRQLC